MKILTARQIKLLESATLQTQNIQELELVKRAGLALFKSITSKLKYHSEFAVFCGTGKNGADGLYCAKLLGEMGHKCRVYVLKLSKTPNNTFLKILDQLDQTLVPVEYINSINNFPKIRSKTIIIDAMLGTGLNRPLKGLIADVVQKINATRNNIVVSVDMPTGLMTEVLANSSEIIQANYTFTFETPKLTQLLPESYPYVGEWKVLPIGLDQKYLNKIETHLQYIDSESIKTLSKKLHREKFSHKGDFGHTLVVAGSLGKMGAAILTTKSALKSGAGLVTALVPAIGYEIMQISVPEAMTNISNDSDFIENIDVDLNVYKTIAMGPGLGTSTETIKAIKTLLRKVTYPIVIDADAINIFSADRSILEEIPKNSIFTPHIKEFDRLVGPSTNSIQRLEKQRTFAIRYNQIVVLKGAHTSISFPNGLILFNSTGNPGMATAGSGDVLTGTIAGMLSQGLKSAQAAILGVYYHGLAGDLAKKELGVIGINATDIINNLPKAINSH